MKKTLQIKPTITMKPAVHEHRKSNFKIVSKNLIFLLLFVTSFGFATNPPINNPGPYGVCDDNGDGFSMFNLSAVANTVLGSLNPSDYNITYHETFMDAQLGSPFITNAGNYMNITAGFQTIYIRVVENASGDFSTTTLDLIVHIGPPLFFAPDLIEDDGIPADGAAIFNLTTQDPILMGGAAGVSIIYYTSVADAANGTNAILNPSAYVNMSNPQTIAATVTDNATGCFSISSFNLIVNSNPFPINTPSNYNICDEDFNGLGIFDLTTKNAEILGALSPSDYTVTYHETMTDANLGFNPLASPYMNIVNPQTVYVRVVENTSGDFSVTNLLLIVNAQPNLVSPIPSLNMYETPTDGFATFDLISHESVILNGPSPPGIVFSFFTSQADAMANANMISNAHAFNGSHLQTIWVRAEYVWVGCYTVSSFVLKVVDSANLIVFPDANFKAKLISANPTNMVAYANANYVSVDTNGDGEIQFTEAAIINRLDVSNANIGDLTGILYFTNLNYLNCSDNQLTSLDISGMTTMVELSCYQNNIATLAVSGLPNLTILTVYQNLLNSLDLSGLPSLQTLNCESNNLSALNFASNPDMITINCSNNAINSLNCTNLTNLAFLNCGNNVALSSLTLSNLPALEQLMVFSTNLGSLNVSPFPTLKYLDCNNAQLSTLNVSGLSQLTYLSCTGNQLLTLNTSTLANLQNLSCANNQLTTLDLAANVDLEGLFCWDNNITTLDVADLTLLNHLDCHGNGMTTLQLGANTALAQLDCGYNDLTVLNTAPLTNLMNLVCWNNDLTSLDLSQNVNLQYVSCNDNLFTTLDFNSNINLVTISVFNNPNLTALFIKNGRNELNDDSLLNCPNLVYVCADDAQIPSIIASYPAVTANSLCTFTPGGNYNTITETATLDINNNGCESSDPPMSFLGLGIQIDGISTLSSVFTNNVGLYNLYTGFPGIYQLSPNIENPTYFTTSPVDINVTTIDNSTVTQNICVTPNGIHPDLEVVLSPVTPARPGFNATYKIVYKNKGNQTLSGTVTCSYNDSVLDYVSATVAPTSLATNTITWNYSSLLPFENRSLEFTLNVNSPVETPPVNIGNILTFTTSITPVAGDEIPADNTFQFNQIVVGSYDPNDITCLQGAVVSPSEIGNYLHYIVNFENTGTFYAENVVVQDLIDTNQYDISSLQILNASHPMTARITGNKVEFIFEHINLAAVGGNPPVGGHGNVLFKIKSKSSLVANDFVMKNANIFFDYNAPITTNTAQTIFQLLNNGIFESDNSIKIFPNPTHGMVNITSDNSIDSVEIYDIQGRILEKSFESASTITLDISNRQSGIYFVKITTEKGSKVEKIVKE